MINHYIKRTRKTMSLLLLETPSSFCCYLGCCSCGRLQGIQFYHQRLCKIPSDYISRMTDVALGNLNSHETTVIVGAKPMWELQIWKSINTKRKGILIKLKIHFITKKSTDCFCLMVHFCSPGCEGVFFLLIVNLVLFSW